MIAFLGDSFTWGQGLPMEMWIETNKFSIAQINNLMPPKHPSELYNYEDDVYRKQNHFPNLVAKHFNKSYITKFGNGGTNKNIVDIIKKIDSQCDGNGIDFYVIQFTEVSRDPYIQSGMNEWIEDYNNLTLKDNSVEKMFEKYIKEQIKTIDNMITTYNKKWYGFSWRDDFGKILEENYPKNYIPIDYNNKSYNNFEELRNEHRHLMLSGKYKGIDDSHLNSDGHKVLANSIINKINLYL